mmetsp:Transcript_40565/g.79943  ORF Transcript_40565/g.79943 Transcript_40565/m.79943 type:complete len:755 (+) Transcript_40565:170-2434(+)
MHGRVLPKQRREKKGKTVRKLKERRLVDLLHLGGVLCGALSLLERGEVCACLLLLVLVDAEAELDHPVDAGGELGRLLEGEPGGQEGGVEEEPDEVLDRLVGLVSRGLLLQLLHDRVVCVHLHGLLAHHVGGHGVVPEGLSLHDPLHVGRPAVLGGHEDAGGLGDSLTEHHLVDLVVKDLLHQLAQRLVLCLHLLKLLLLLLVRDLESLLGDALELLALKFLQLLHGVFVNGVNHVEDLVALLLESLEEGGVLHCLTRLAGDVENVLLALLHAVDVLVKGDQVLTGLGCVVAQQLCHLQSVGGVLVNAELEVLGELLVELLVVVLVLRDLGEHLEALLHEVLLDDLEDFVLLKGLTRDVQREILRVNNTSAEVEPLRNQLLAVVHDEHTTDVELDVVPLLAGLKEIEGCSAGHKEQSLELQLTLDGEVLHTEVVLPIVGDGLVERGVLLGGDVLSPSHPDGLVLVHLLEGVGDLLDLLGLLLLVLLFLLLLLNLGLVIVLFLLFLIVLLLFLLLLVIGDLLLCGLLDRELDGEADELGVLLDQILEASLLKVFGLILLQVKDDSGATAERLRALVLCDGEGATGRGLPDVLLVIVVLGDDSHLVSNEVGGVETHTELSDHADVTTGLDGLHEGLGSGPGDGTEVVDQIGLGHTDPGILNGEGVVGLVRHNADVVVRVVLHHLMVGEGLVTDLIESIGRVGNQLTKEDLFVGIEGVDDQRHQLLDVSIEGVSLGHFGQSVKTEKDSKQKGIKTTS